MTGPGRLHQLSSELRELRAALMLGGGEDRIRRQHDQGKWTARERIGRLFDSDSEWVEVGMLVAHDQYEGQAPGAGVVTGVGVVALQGPALRVGRRGLYRSHRAWGQGECWRAGDRGLP